MATLPDPSHFPALERLSWRERRRRVPCVRQHELTDCGAACLAMVLQMHGKSVRLDELRTALGIDRDGSSAADLLEAAGRYGMLGRGLQLEPTDLRHVPPGAILHWDFNHFVVFERWTPSGIRLVDPARGRRFVPHARVEHMFTGVALVLQRTEQFTRGRAGERPTWAYLRRLFLQRATLGRVILVSLMLRLFALGLPLLTALVVGARVGASIAAELGTMRVTEQIDALE
nr:ABC transporter permease [Deltaproteobacteria bacterium]